jgi:HK97 family phage portal protein
VAEHTTASGLAVVVHRAGEATTSAVTELASPPGGLLTPAPWAGWPTEWAVPWWSGRGDVETLVDTAWACLDLNASVLAAMPPYLVNAAATLPASWLINPDPDVYTSWYEFAKQLAWDFQLGEAFVLATARYRDGWPAQFHVVPPWMVNVDIGRDGLRKYKIGNAAVSTDDLLHIRYKSAVGNARGIGPLEAGRSRLVAAATLAHYASTFVAGGGVPYYALTHEEELDAQQAADLLAAWWTSRTSNLGQPAVLGGGIQIQPLQVSPRDMALVELSQWNESHIATLLGVPAALVNLPSNGDSLTYSTALMAREQHWQGGLKPKATALMQALSGWVLPRATHIELNRDEYVEPGPLEQAQTVQILAGIVDPITGQPAISVSEIRELLRLSVAAPSQSLTSGVLQ